MTYRFASQDTLDLTSAGLGGQVDLAAATGNCSVLCADGWGNVWMILRNLSALTYDFYCLTRLGNIVGPTSIDIEANFDSLLGTRRYHGVGFLRSAGCHWMLTTSRTESATSPNSACAAVGRATLNASQDEITVTSNGAAPWPNVNFGSPGGVSPGVYVTPSGLARCIDGDLVTITIEFYQASATKKYSVIKFDPATGNARSNFPATLTSSNFGTGAIDEPSFCADSLQLGLDGWLYLPVIRSSAAANLVRFKVDSSGIAGFETLRNLATDFSGIASSFGFPTNGTMIQLSNGSMYFALRGGTTTSARGIYAAGFGSAPAALGSLPANFEFPVIPSVLNAEAMGTGFAIPDGFILYGIGASPEQTTLRWVRFDTAGAVVSSSTAPSGSTWPSGKPASPGATWGQQRFGCAPSDNAGWRLINVELPQVPRSVTQ